MGVMGRGREGVEFRSPPSLPQRACPLRWAKSLFRCHRSPLFSHNLISTPTRTRSAVVEQGPTGVHVLRLHASTHGIALVGMCVAVSAGAIIAHRPALNTDGWQSKTDEEVNDGSPVNLRCCNAHLHLPLHPRHPLFFSGWLSEYRPRTVQQVRAEIGPLPREKFI